MKADYTYLDDGKKITAVNANDSGYEYLGSFVYSRNNNVISLESASFNGGRIEKASSGYEINYFITDQLGSTRAVVNQNMVTSSNRYTNNGKDDQNFFVLKYLDYGARFYDPCGRLGFTSIDPHAENYYDLSPYVYCANNPVNAIDPDGRKVLFVNGHYQNNIIGDFLGRASGEKYWGKGFASAAQNFFNDHSPISSSNYIDGSSKWGGDMSGQDRYDASYAYAKANINSLTSGMEDVETFKMVTHSESSAYGAGVAQYLLDNGYNVQTIVHLSPDEGDEFSTPKSPMTYQLANDGDWVTGNKMISEVDKFGLVNSGLGAVYVHGQTKTIAIFNPFKQMVGV